VELIMLLIGLFGGFALHSGIKMLTERRFNFLIASEKLEYETLLNKKEEKLAYQQSVIQSVQHDIHHSSAVVNAQRIRGILSLYRLEVSNLSKRLTSIGKTTWGEAIEIDFREVDEKYFKIIEEQAKIIEYKIVNSAEPLNKLQE
jgi:hypothetical protein